MIMKCEIIETQLIDFIEENLSEKESVFIEKHIKNCSSCQKELAETKEFLAVLGEEKMEFPSKNLRANFEKMLAEEKELQQPKVIQLQSKNTDWKSYLRVAASVLLVVSAFFIGKYQSNINPVSAENQQETKQKENVLALLENTSASTRIAAVNESENFKSTDTKIIQALINRLFFDKNTNVRSAAAEALSKFTSEEMVKIALIKSLETEEDSSIQIELIRILTQIQEKRAVKPMQELLKKEETPQYVKLQVEQNLPNLL